MKKLYMAIAAAMLATCAQAQTIHLMLGDQVLEEGAKIEYNDVEITDDPDYYAWSFAPPLYVVGSETGKIDARANCTTGQQIQFCLGQSCFNGSNVSINGHEITANTPEYAQFHFEHSVYAEEDKDGNIIPIPDAEKAIPADVEVAFFFGYTEYDEAYATMTMTLNKGGKAGTVKVFGKGDSLVSVNGVLEYSVEGTSDLALYTTDGNRVLKQTVIGNGTVSTASLAKGVYVYTLGNKSGKLVVK